MAEQLDRTAMESTARAAIAARATPVTIATVRTGILDGELIKARSAFDQLAGRAGANTEMLLTEALLLEAEGKAEEAVRCLHRVLNAVPASPRANAQANLRIARLAVRLGLPLEAEAAARALLAVDPDDIEGLRALAFVQGHRDDHDARLATLRRVTLSADATEEDIWLAIGAFESARRWTDVTAILDQREFELDPWRLVPCRLRALIARGWQRRALAHLLKGYADGYVRANDAIDILLEAGALAVAAGFADQALFDSPWQSPARAIVMAEALRVCTPTSLREDPLRHADALKARDIFQPGDAALADAIASTLEYLEMEAARLLEEGDPAGATQFLVAAVRLSPSDRPLLESLAEAARHADLRERYLDTLMRIWTGHQDAEALLATARGVLDESPWPQIAEVMAIATSEAAAIGLDMGAVARKFRDQACRRLDECIRSGDVSGGLELVTALAEQFPLDEWPQGLLPRLLRAAKRRLRGHRGATDAVAASIGTLYLELDPNDPDVCRMMGRSLARQKRPREARELLRRVVEANPHVASDWVALAMAHHELGGFDERDFCTARAIVICPDIALPPALSPFRAQMVLA